MGGHGTDEVAVRLNSFNGAAFGNGVFVTVGVNPPDYSTHLDQVKSTLRGTGLLVEGILYPDPLRASQLNSVVFAADRFVAVGNTSSETRSFSVTSVNGQDWTVQNGAQLMVSRLRIGCGEGFL